MIPKYRYQNFFKKIENLGYSRLVTNLTIITPEMGWISLEPCGIAFQKCTKIDANTTHAHTHNNRKSEGEKDSERSVKKLRPKA